MFKWRSLFVCLFLCRSHFRRKKKVGEVGAHGGNLSSAVPPPQLVRLLLLSPFTISHFLIQTTLASSPFRVSVCRSEPDLRQGEGRRSSASPQHLSRRGGTRGGRGSRGEQRGRRWKWRDRPVRLWGVDCECCSFWQGRLLYDHTRCAEHSQWKHTHTHTHTRFSVMFWNIVTCNCVSDVKLFTYQDINYWSSMSQWK